ncbi:hypothetical protein BCR44DRAFT_266488 [Catenaria anguillulae PL171]|uniref:Uncharacterized protein n=1 Tax=Catenaria anguillulae PL171 TaxID=765915 RepID=A0A1Y2HBS1_9FUNG|nr:hypothetical protein BCR44DRAFT_266488 [Catenaria anguillulae PL171]
MISISANDAGQTPLLSSLAYLQSVGYCVADITQRTRATLLPPTRPLARSIVKAPSLGNPACNRNQFSNNLRDRESDVPVWNRPDAWACWVRVSVNERRGCVGAMNGESSGCPSWYIQPPFLRSTLLLDVWRMLKHIMNNGPAKVEACGILLLDVLLKQVVPLGLLDVVKCDVGLQSEEHTTNQARDHCRVLFARGYGLQTTWV